LSGRFAIRATSLALLRALAYDRWHPCAPSPQAQRRSSLLGR
jgi:hypothetical protein